MVVIFDMNTGKIDAQEGSQPEPEQHINTPGPEQDISVQLQEVESFATTPEQSTPPLLHQDDAEHFLHRMEAKTRQSR